jgi:hypothetical protein
LYFRSESDKSNSGTPQKPSKTSTGLSSQTYEELMNMASQPELNDLYDSFWNYFYSFGSFPPADFMASMNMKAKDIVKKSKTLNQNSKSRQQSLDMNHSVQNQTNSQILSGEITPSAMDNYCHTPLFSCLQPPITNEVANQRLRLALTRHLIC